MSEIVYRLKLVKIINYEWWIIIRNVFKREVNYY